MKKIFVFSASLAGAVLLQPAMLPAAHADIVSTHEFVQEQQSGLNRAQLTEQLQREDVRELLVQYGVDPDEALERVAALTDEEVLQLTANINELPAGAGISISVTVILIGILVWLIFFR
ncbi:PA2779 family protein [Alkalimonas amylolytica]|uniref:PA2779 family protein n=1 Tax=Alkalimonas amylolytica TaxID=152573 RepID=A0A1H4G231_ALKAM|nr:PA2779 family protein [Alkalimonas amylolytica]SEB03635.1 hypothetical protein SAMN04488051_11624 [Alkalimonas amylolytica]